MKNLSMLTDYYQLTMIDGYINDNKHEKEAVFDLFYRKNPFNNGYSIFAGLQQIIDYIENLEFTEDDIDYLKHFDFSDKLLDYLVNFEFTGNIYAMPEGSVVFPNEPLIKVKAQIAQAQLIETTLLNLVNHQSLIATKASRIKEVVGDDTLIEFGLRRGHGPDAGLYGARAAIIGGCDGTSNVMSGKKFGTKISGTHAHSWIMSYDSEIEAFRAYARRFPNSCILLVDTYDTLKSGVPNAIKVFKELREQGIKSEMYGIRLDSGDLAYLSKEARKMLDHAGFPDATIVASNDLDEDLIYTLKDQGARIDVWGVGTNLITSKGNPAFGAVYKLAEFDSRPKIKISENIIKITNPGDKEVYRIRDKNDKILADLITINTEIYNNANDLTIFDPHHPWKKATFKADEYTIIPQLHPVFKDGNITEKGRLFKNLSLEGIKGYSMNEKDDLWPEYKRLVNPEIMKVDLSKKLYDLKQLLLFEGGE